MKTPRIGIASIADMKARTMAVARGELKLGPDEPKLWFTSIKSLARVLSRRLKGDLTGQALIAAMQASPHRDIEIEPPRAVSKRETRRFLTAELSDEEAERIASSRMDTRHDDLDKLLDPK